MGNDIVITGRVGHHVAAAIEDQKRIGRHLMLHGILSKKWQEAIAAHTNERVGSKMGHLVKVIWKQIFKPMWNQRNAVLHTEGSIARVKENELLEAALHKFKQNYRDLLHYTQ